MYEFKNILVALNHNDLDIQLTKSASFLSKISKSENVYFINIVKDLNIPDSIKKEFPDMLANAVNERKKEIEAVVKKFFTPSSVNIHIEIKTGVPVKAIMKYSSEKNIDLILTGRLNNEKGGGTLVNRLARRAGCSLLIIPNKYKRRVNRILVPIDYSSHSKEALLQAIDLAKKNLPDIKLIVQNVYQVPNGFHSTGKTFDEFAQIMKENSQKSYRNFMRDVDTKNIDTQPLYTLDKGEDVIKEIYKAALDIDADSIMIGAKGRSATTALFIGSSAEKLIQIDSEIPIMIVRPSSGKTQKGFLDLLMEI